jgi:PAT family beta-lactamase induction signal transducer AmpG
MIDLEKRKFAKYFLFSSLYFSEGLKWSIAVVIFPVYFDDLGISPTILGLVIALTGLPVMIKFIFGGIIDYFIKYGRKKFVLFGGLAASISLFIISFINPATSLIPFMIIFFIGIIGITFLDVAADAWAIEITKEEERGKVNGGMFAGIFIGMGVGSLFFTQIASNISYSTVFLVAGLMVLLIILFPLAVKEVKKVKKIQKIRSTLIREFKNKTVQIFCVFAPTIGISGGLLLIVVPLYMKNVLMMDVAQIGLIAAIFPIANIFGSLVGGFMADSLGRKPTIYIVFSGSMVFSASLIFADTWQILAVLYGIIGFLFGCLYASIGALSMDVTNPRLAGTQFSIYMALFNVGEVGIGNGMAGILLDNLGYERVFLYSGLLYGLAILILYFVRLKKKND